MNEMVVEVKNVSMMFNISREKCEHLKEYIIKRLKNQLSYEVFWALNDVSFSVKRGESLGIVGLNGSGKSTLLKIIAGVIKPTEGSVKVKGSISPLIELGAGFDMELSAKENVYLNGSILGYKRSEIDEYYDEIISFAELEEFQNVPIKNFSSGMIARLGFSISTIRTPSLLIVDEILGVGDYKFQQKCEEKMDKMLREGTTLIFVSHSAEQVKKVCKNVLWLEHGKMMDYGESTSICDKYLGVK